MPMARDLFEPLGDTPAGRFLQQAIAIQTQRDENRRKQAEMGTPKAVAARKVAKRSRRQELSAARCNRK